MRDVLLNQQLWWLAVLAAVTFAAGFFQAAAGFGFALFAVPVASLVATPRDVVVMVFLTASVISLALTRTQRELIVWPEAKRLGLGAVVAMPFGLWLLQSGSANALRLILGVCTITAALWSMLVARRITTPWPAPWPLTVAVGALSGVLNTAVATNGPPLVIYLQGRRLTPDQFRATISFVFSLSNAVGLVVLLAGNAIHVVDVEMFLVTVATAALGTIIGLRVSRRIDNQHFGLLVNALLLAGGATALIRAIAG